MVACVVTGVSAAACEAGSEVYASKEASLLEEAATVCEDIQKALNLLGSVSESVKLTNGFLLVTNCSLQKRMKEMVSIHSEWQNVVNAQTESLTTGCGASVPGSYRKFDRQFVNNLDALRNAMDELKDHLGKVRSEVKTARKLVDNARCLL